MADNTKKLHIVMFPWLALGHMIPLLELSKLIAQKGHKISFLSTPKNIQCLPQNKHPLINFVQLPLPKVDNLPETAESTVDLPYDKVKYLKSAYDGLKRPFSQFLQQSSPAVDCVLYDFVSYWVPSVASELNILKGYFSPFTASAVAFCGPSESLMGNDDSDDQRTHPEDFTVPPKWIPFETNVCFKLFEVLRMFDGITGDEENVSDLFRLGSSINGADFLAMRGCYEFEPEWFKVLEDIHRKPVIPVGQLVTTTMDESKDEAWRSIKEWLDKREKGSVVYVAFGSEVKPSQTELNEIALGLELSGLPFLWVLSTKRGEMDTEVVELPEGFEDRSKGRGMVCTSWAPQLKILSHESVGGYFTHSGWGSALEAIQCELPLILLPFLFDQGLNARVLEAKKMGYSVPRDDRDGSFTGDSVADSLRLVMIEEEGKIYREKSKEMKELLCNEAAQDRYVDSLLDYIQNIKGQKSQTC